MKYHEKKAHLIAFQEIAVEKFKNGKIKESRDYLIKAQKVARELISDNPSEGIFALVGVGDVQMATNLINEADDTLHEALTWSFREENPCVELERIAEVYIRARIFQKAEKVINKMENPHFIIDTFFEWARVQARDGMDAKDTVLAAGKQPEAFVQALEYLKQEYMAGCGGRGFAAKLMNISKEQARLGLMEEALQNVELLHGLGGGEGARADEALFVIAQKFLNRGDLEATKNVADKMVTRKRNEVYYKLCLLQLSRNLTADAEITVGKIRDEVYRKYALAEVIKKREETAPQISA